MLASPFTKEEGGSEELDHTARMLNARMAPALLISSLLTPLSLSQEHVVLMEVKIEMIESQFVICWVMVGRSLSVSNRVVWRFK